jgi:hypothetical protein
LSQEQISDFLAERNFFKIPSYRHLEYYNPKGRVFLQDAHSGNVVSGFDANGAENIFLIDTPFRFATEADAATIEQFNRLMRGKLINGKISQERYAELKPFLTDPTALEYWEGEPKFSLRNPEKLDSEYKAAFEAKDEEQARGLVDEAARAAGYKYKMYRGVENDYLKGNAYVFEKADETYFTSDKQKAENYAYGWRSSSSPDSGAVYDVYLKMENPWIPDRITDAQGWEYYDRQLREQGYDGVIGAHGGKAAAERGDIEVAVVFDPSQIKSADPFTYDNEGNLIPLSERFNSGTGDVRFSLTNEGSPGVLEGIQMDPKEKERLLSKDALSGVQFSLNAKKSLTSEEEMRKLDALADKKAKQVDADTLPYPVNPNADSVTLPPRYGLVNANIVGMPKSFKDVQTLLNGLVTRLTNVASRDPQFALEAASFYSDMADSALKLADAIKPDVSGMEKWLSAELNMRFLALGSPKSAVAANATKSGSSVAGSASDFAAGFKIGMGEQAIGAATTQKAWKRGEHFDLSLPGVQDKVRSFYLNGLAELIELAQKEGDAAAVKELMLRAGKSMRVFEPSQTELSDAGIKEVQRLLDGKATVDMWDMAAKGEAWPGYLMTMSERNKKTEPFQWSQDKFEKKSSLATPQWQKVLKELNISGPQDLRYQQARALKIDGNAAWDEVSWEARKKQPFPDTTPFSYYTKATEAGLSPGGGGPLYDAQQAIDGMLADRLNELGFAKMFGKEKLKARNAQEILWALEKLDNPIKRNNDLSLFKASFDPFMDEIMALRGIPTAARSHLGRNVLGAMDRTYGEMARQVMPLEVVSSGTSVEAKRIQQRIADLQAAGDVNAAKTLTDSVADGLHNVINTLADKYGLKVTADRVAVGEGGYTEANQLNIAPNMRIVLRGDPARTYQVLESLSRALDQDGGNIIRKPSVRELNDVQKVKNLVLTFDTTHLSPGDRNNFFLEAAKLTDANGNPFLTGFTETEAGLAVGNQFYEGDFKAAISLNQQQLQALTSKYSIPKMAVEKAIIDTFYRGQDPSKTTTSPFAKAIYDHIASRLSATPSAAPFPQTVNFETLWRGRADSLNAAIEQYPIRTKAQIKKAKANAPQIASATKQTQAHTELKSELLAAVLRDEISKDRYKELMIEYGYAKPGKEESDESDE